ncbi:MAG: pyridoxamine 5'-phosphate oxidase family protein [bacterium]
MTEDQDHTATLAELMKDIRFSMLTTVDSDGTLIARPMANQEVEFDGDMWFFAARNSRKVSHLNANSHVGVALSSTDKWVSIDGTAAVVEDKAKARELWNAGVEAWFPDGPDSDDIVLLKVSAESGEYWDNPGGRVATALSFAKAKLTGSRYEGGENEKVDLS